MEGRYRRVPAGQHADLYVINTCTVTAEADRQARQLVRRAVRQNPAAWVVVTGCYAQIQPQTCAEIPGVDLVVGNSQKLDIPDLLDELYQGKLPPILLKDIDREISLPKQLLQGFEGHSRAFVQIQQGCDQGCTFCIIHTARGANRSFPAKMIKRQCQRLIMNGYGEIVICGVDIGSYGSDFQDSNKGINQNSNISKCMLSALLRSLLENDASTGRDYRLRLSSIDPAHISDEFIALLSNHSRICPQLHLSLQSANSLILKRMKRRATKALIYERISALRAAVPDLVLSADILVGFPTETEAHFSDTLRAIHELEIAYPHVFRYSPRPATPAARIPSQVPIPIRKQRAKAAREAGKEVWKKVATAQLGKRTTVLVEAANDKGNGKVNDNGRINSDWSVGRAANYFPVKFKDTLPKRSREEYRNQQDNNCRWVDLKIIGVGDNILLGSMD